MSDAQPTLTLSGLTPLEAAELKGALAKAGCDPETGLRVTPEPGAVGGAKKGEPFTMMALFALSQLALTGLSIYLAKGRSGSRRKVKLSYTAPSGESLVYELETEAHQEEAIRADLMTQIAKLKIPTPAAGSTSG